MVKRCGKSAPREAQATRHGKPHRVQGQIGNRGAARSAPRESATGFGYWLLRQMILSVSQEAQTKFGLQPFQNHFNTVFVGTRDLLRSDVWPGDECRRIANKTSRIAT